MYPQATSISSDLISYLRDLYTTAFNEIILRNGNSNVINGYTKHAIPAYIIAVTGIEAFLNEMFLSPAGRKFLKNAPENAAFWSALESARLIDKLAFVPQLFFGRTFETGKQPYQEIKNLIMLRNDLAHYKMRFKPPSCFRDLQQRRIALNETGKTWPYNSSSLEGMRWAHNTICETIQALSHFATQETHPIMAHIAGYDFYKPWPNSFIRAKANEILEKHKVGCIG